MNRVWLLSVIVCLANIHWTCQAQLGDLFKPRGTSAGRPTDTDKAVGITTNIFDIFKGVGGIPLEEELQLGGAVAVEIVARFGGLLKDTNATQRINLIGKSVARYGNRPELNYRFGILNSPDVNAFSAPAGYVFITKGLYDQAVNDDQLAGVLAHEIAHVTERHALKIISRNKVFSAGIKIGSLTTGELREFGQGIDSLTKVLLERGFDPQTEYAADQEARRVAQMTGFAPDGLKEVLQSLADKEAASAKVFTTHPALKSRIDKLDQAPSNRSASPPKKPARR